MSTLVVLVPAPASITSSLANGALDAVASWVADGAAWFITRVAAALASTTNLSLRAAWFGAVLSKVSAFAVPVSLATLSVAAGRAVLRRRLDELGRCILVTLPLAGLTTLGAAEVTQMALDATDAASSSLVGGRNGTVVHGLAGLVASLGNGNGVPSMVHFALAGICVLGAIVLWIELLVRNAGVATAVLFTPLVVAASIWPALHHWPRRLAETLAALVLAKLVVAGVLALAFSAVHGGHGPAATMLGGALLILSAMAPFTLMKLVPMAEGGAALALEGARRHATAPVSAALRTGTSTALSSWGTAVGTEQAMGAVGQEATAFLGVPMHPGGGPMPDLGGPAPSPGAPPHEPSPEAPPRPATQQPPTVERPEQPGAAAPPVDAAAIGTNGSYELGRDHLGPVLRWVGERG